MVESADNLMPLAALLYATLAALVAGTVHLVRSGRIPGPAAARGGPTSSVVRRGG